jgi:hypothetical protein
MEKKIAVTIDEKNIEASASITKKSAPGSIFMNFHFTRQ